MTHADENNVLTTNLLVDDLRLKQMAKTGDFWTIEIHELDDDSNQVFYKNLIRLTAVYRVAKEKFSFRIYEANARNKALAERLTQIGFKNICFIQNQSIVEEPELEYGKQPGLFFDEYKVAGLSYHIKEDDEIWDLLNVGSKVKLEAQPNNTYDENAVAIKFDYPLIENGTKIIISKLIGYIPSSDNARISALLNAGWNEIFNCRISSIEMSEAYHSRLRIEVYIRNKKDCNIL